MPPKESSSEDVSPTTILPLQEWLKLLSSRGVDMRVAMGLAAKIYNSHNTKQRLSKLDTKMLMSIVPDKEARKSIVNAVNGIETGKAMNKKRTRDSDLLEPLRPEKETIPKSLDFNEILDPESLIPVDLTVNRAPLKTAWAYTVARRMGFDAQEALSIAHVYVHISSMKHALVLGNILNKDETREAEAELRELPGEESRYPNKAAEQGRGWKRGREKEVVASVGSSQPWVGIMKAKPVIERSDGTWRAIQQGDPVQPSVAYLYITRAFRDYTPHVMGSLRLLAESYTADELNRLGLHMYSAFKPDVEEWGQRGILECAKILDQLKAPIPDEAETIAAKENGIELPTDVSPTQPINIVALAGDKPQAAREIDQEDEEGSALSDPPAPGEDLYQPITKKPKMTLEEYEAMLDAENAEGGFLEGGDIPGA